MLHIPIFVIFIPEARHDPCANYNAYIKSLCSLFKPSSKQSHGTHFITRPKKSFIVKFNPELGLSAGSHHIQPTETNFAKVMDKKFNQVFSGHNNIWNVPLVKNMANYDVEIFLPNVCKHESFTDVPNFQKSLLYKKSPPRSVT